MIRAPIVSTRSELSFMTVCGADGIEWLIPPPIAAYPVDQLTLRNGWRAFYRWVSSGATPTYEIGAFGPMLVFPTDNPHFYLDRPLTGGQFLPPFDEYAFEGISGRKVWFVGHVRPGAHWTGGNAWNNFAAAGSYPNDEGAYFGYDPTNKRWKLQIEVSSGDVFMYAPNDSYVQDTEYIVGMSLVKGVSGDWAGWICAWPYGGVVGPVWEVTSSAAGTPLGQVMGQGPRWWGNFAGGSGAMACGRGKIPSKGMLQHMVATFPLWIQQQGQAVSKPLVYDVPGQQTMVKKGGTRF